MTKSYLPEIADRQERDLIFCLNARGDEVSGSFLTGIRFRNTHLDATYDNLSARRILMESYVEN